MSSDLTITAARLRPDTAVGLGIDGLARVTIYDMISIEGAMVLGISDFERAVGHQANLVVLGATTVRDALLEHEPPRWVIKTGQVISGAQ